MRDFVPCFPLIKTSVGLRQRGSRVALRCDEYLCSLPYTLLWSRLELIHDSPEKIDQFFRRFEARVLSGHHVLCSSGETGRPWFCGVAKLNDKDQVRQVPRRRIGHDFFLPFLFGSLVAPAVHHVIRIGLKAVSIHRRSVEVPWNFR